MRINFDKDQHCATGQNKRRQSIPDHRYYAWTATLNPLNLPQYKQRVMHRMSRSLSNGGGNEMRWFDGSSHQIDFSRNGLHANSLYDVRQSFSSSPLLIYRLFLRWKMLELNTRTLFIDFKRMLNGGESLRKVKEKDARNDMEIIRDGFGLFIIYPSSTD